MSELTTERLELRRFIPEDADFILELLNEPPFLEFIGDKGVRTVDDAVGYLSRGPLASYERHGYGLYCIERRSDGERLGMCGLVCRDTLPHPDIGYALAEAHWGQGYAEEAARATVQEACSLGLPVLLAITSPENSASIRLLEKRGMSARGTIDLGPSDSPRLFELLLA